MGNNTELRYLYRDASNYKQYGTTVFAGTPDDLTSANKALLHASIDRCLFIPEQVDLPNLRDDWESHYEDDHVWNELCDPPLALTWRRDENGMHINDFIATFTATTWDEQYAADALEEWKSDTKPGR